MQGGAKSTWPGPGRRIASLCPAACSAQHRTCVQAHEAASRCPGQATALTTAKLGTPPSCSTGTGPLPGAGPARLDTLKCWQLVASLEGSLLSVCQSRGCGFSPHSGRLPLSWSPGPVTAVESASGRSPSPEHDSSDHLHTSAVGRVHKATTGHTDLLSLGCPGQPG